MLMLALLIDIRTYKYTKKVLRIQTVMGEKRRRNKRK